MELAECVNRPLAIAGRTIASRLVLAPMSQLGNLAFRAVVAGFGGFGLLFSEMCSARTVPNGPNHPLSAFRWQATELGHLVCQLYGREPHEMAHAARRVQQEGFFGVDLNFGCCAAALCRNGCGAALLREPEHAGRIVETVRRAVSIPLFVKYRIGWRDNPASAVELARRFEAAGADALTFHPRMAPDRRTRRARWETIAPVKAAVSIPVFGNGDVFTAQECRRMFMETGCDGIALGRIAVARPWVFAQWAHGVVPTREIQRRAVREHARLLGAYFPAPVALRLFRRFSAFFAANFAFGHALLRELGRCPDLEGTARLLDGFLASGEPLVERPNTGLFQ
jgi:nifR3 family TIM-barrel protein